MTQEPQLAQPIMASSPAAGRRGFVLLLVLVAVMLLSFSAYVLAELMLVAAQATAHSLRRAQARAFADSGRDYLGALLEQRRSDKTRDLIDNPDTFRGVLVRPAKRRAERGRFSVTAPPTSQAEEAATVYGLIDESSRLNLHALPLDAERAKHSRQRLMALEGMTLRTADAILDWLDEDSRPRQFGTEKAYYSTLNPAYAPKNGPLSTLEELLMVRGVTPALLYGEGSKPGWVSELTLYAGESNIRPDGRPKIDVNHPSLARVYDELEAEFGTLVAKFVVGYRLFGSVQRDGEGPGESTVDPLEAAKRRAREQLDGDLDEALPVDPQDRTRGGFDLSEGGPYRVRSLYDLCGVAVRAFVNGQDQILDSPWSADPADIAHSVAELSQRVTTQSGRMLAGRINVNQASRDVVLSVPGMTTELADAIRAAQRGIGGQSLAQRASRQRSTAWLLEEGLVDLPMLRRLAPYLTARGDVFRARVTGYFEVNGPAAQIEVVVDATGQRSRVVYHRDLATWRWDPRQSHSALQ